MQIYVATAEIVASAAVVASLVFVVISLNQNTAAIQSANDNFLYQPEGARLADVTINSDMADFKSTVIGRLSRETWNRSSSCYGTEFRDHVEAAYAEQ